MDKKSYFPLYTKWQKHVKAVLRHLSHNTPAENICDGLTIHGFEVSSDNQRLSPVEGTASVTLPLFLITLPRTAKSEEVFNLPNLCHIAIKVGPYKSQNILTGMAGQTTNNLSVLCGTGANTCTRTDQRERNPLQHRYAVTARRSKERQHILPTAGATGIQKRESTSLQLQELQAY
jgi:hypothetical protein